MLKINLSVLVFLFIALATTSCFKGGDDADNFVGTFRPVDNGIIITITKTGPGTVQITSIRAGSSGVTADVSGNSITIHHSL